MRLRAWVTVWVVASLGVWTGCSSSSSSGGGGTGDLLVATQSDMSVSSFQVDLGTGKLSAQGTSATTGMGSVPSAMVITPDGNSAFVANGGSNDIARFMVNSDGTVTGVTPNQPATMNPMILALDPTSLAVDSGGKFLFVANQGSDNISIFSISGTTLTEVAGSPFPTDPDPAGIAVAPSNNFVYVSNSINGTVSAYTFDSTTGALAAIPGSPYTTTGTAPGIAPAGLAVAAASSGNASGTFLYVANSGSSNVSAFAICTTITTTCLAADGSLTQVTGSPFSAQPGPVAIVAAPSGEFLYVADKQANQISSYKIGAATGVLTPTSPANISTGLNPVSIAMPSSGQFVYVTNIGSASISAYTIATDTKGTPTGALKLADKPLLTAGQPAAVALK
ncbi:MAG: lactonase family protein [Acidobacteriia bacterium]|nr:lactonase family protein [Terriglobia bacterium]